MGAARDIFAIDCICDNRNGVIPLHVEVLRKFEANAWVYNFALVGLVLYTAFPFQGSGGAVGSIFGRILGMDKKKVFVAITGGACLGAFPFAYLAYWGMGLTRGLLTDEQKMIGGIIVLIIVAITVMYLSKLDEEKYGDKAYEGKEE